ncbi:MAG: efflux RND transporter periplasmic adaptor subunit [Rubrivivax sp.]|nr:MAG: efflux RND transporter periplasmic adaptor subunit [Rubrivivax sp.]
MNTPPNLIDRLRGRVGTKQLFAIAAVLLIGALSAVAILNIGPKTGGSEEEHGHDEAEAHAKPSTPPASPQARGHEHQGEEGEHHEEGQTVIKMTADAITAAGVTVEPTHPAAIRTTLQLPGEIKFNEDRTAHVVPRVMGVVEAVPAALGQQVRKGELLAVLSSPSVSEQRADLQSAQQRLVLARTTYEREKQLWLERISPQQDVQQAEQALREAEIAVNNARQKLLAIGASAGGGSSLNRFELRAPFDGLIVAKHISLGEQVKEDSQVFTISDLRSVWAQISVPARDLAQVRVGQRVTVRSAAFEQSARGKVAFVGSLIGEQTRTADARVTLDNPNAAWRPGLFVNVDLASGEAAGEAPVTVAADAVQTMGDRSVVFIRTDDGFLPQPVRLGRSDGQRTEVISGLKAGTPYAVTGSFLLKSEAGKASASHEH